jgi:uncharacterized membrane-anchored protein
MRRNILIIWSVLVFLVFNYAIYEKEQIIKNGDIVLLELAPVDPRSLIQGDYMRLRYAIERTLSRDSIRGQKKRGYIVIKPDENRVATFIKFFNDEALGPEEKLLRYHKKHSVVRIVPNSFFFQEGTANKYNNAKYGVFKFDDKGNKVLVGLAGSDFQMIE